MSRSRTIRVLVILVLSMTFGAFTLRMLETRPAPFTVTELVASTPPIGAEYDTDVPLKTALWRNIVIHSTGGEPADITGRAHFVIDANGAQLLHPSQLWKAQRQTRHVESTTHDYNADSIAICMKGDFSVNPPPARQLQELIKLVRSLQKSCNIAPENVYLYRPDLASSKTSPNRAFPTRTFTSLLARL